MKAWVNSELKFAEALGLTRLEHTKLNWGADCPDALGGIEYDGAPILLESKSRKGGFPVLIQKALAQAQGYKEAKGRMCIVGLHKNGGRSNNDWLVVTTLKDFKTLVEQAYKER